MRYILKSRRAVFNFEFSRPTGPMCTVEVCLNCVCSIVQCAGELEGAWRAGRLRNTVESGPPVQGHVRAAALSLPAM